MNQLRARLKFGFNFGLLTSIVVTLMMNGLTWSIYDNPSALEPINFLFYGTILSIILIRYVKRKIKVVYSAVRLVNLLILALWAVLLIAQDGINSEPWMTGAGWFYLIYPRFSTILVLSLSTTISFDYLYLRSIQNGEQRDEVLDRKHISNSSWNTPITIAILIVLFMIASTAYFGALGLAIFLNVLVLICVFISIIDLRSRSLDVLKDLTLPASLRDIKELAIFALVYIPLYYIGIQFIDAFHYLTLLMIPLSVIRILQSQNWYDIKIDSLKRGLHLVGKGFYVLFLVMFSYMPVYATPPLYFLPKFLLFFLVGYIAAKYLHSKKLMHLNDNSHKLLLIGLSFLAIHLMFGFLDGIFNGYSYEGPLYNDIWPFVYLGSFVQYLICGFGTYFVAQGTYYVYLISRFNLLSNEATEVESMADEVNLKDLTRTENPFSVKELSKMKSIMLLTVFGFGLCIFVPNYNLFTYGGGTSGGIPAFGDLYHTITSLGYSFFGVLYTLFIIKEFRKMKNHVGERIPKSGIFSLEMFKNVWNEIRRTSKKSLRTGALAFLIIAPVLIVEGYTFYTTHERPIVGYNPGRHLVWIEESTDRVSPQELVATGLPTESGSYEVYMAKNEYEAFQLVVRPLNFYMNDIWFKVTNLQHQTDINSTIDDDNVTIRYAEPVIKNQYPDILKPIASHPNLERNRNHVFWVSIRTSNNTEGTYSGQIEIKANDVRKPVATLNLDVHIWNFTIPEERNIRTNVGRQYTDDDWINNYAAHRINTYGVPFKALDEYNESEGIDWEGKCCWYNKSDSTWIFNWTWWDAQMQKNIDLGMNGFRVRCPLDIPYTEKLWTNESWREGTLNYYAELNDHFVAKGWADYAYIYEVDEPQFHVPDGISLGQFFGYLADLFRDIKAVAPNLKIAITYQPNEMAEIMYPYIDIWIPLSNEFNPERILERQQAGDEIWYYTCVQPNAPYANTMLYNHLYETRILPWMVWFYNLSGYLFWASSSYRHEGYTVGYNGYGDGVLLYDHYSGNLYDSCRWEMLLQGQEDYEYFHMLNQTVHLLQGTEYEGNANLLYQEFTNEFNSLITSHNEFVRASHPFRALRDRVGEMLNELIPML